MTLTAAQIIEEVPEYGIWYHASAALRDVERALKQVQRIEKMDVMNVQEHNTLSAMVLQLEGICQRNHFLAMKKLGWNK